MTRTFRAQPGDGWSGFFHHRTESLRSADVRSSSCRGVASNYPHAVVTVCGSCGARNVGATGFGRRYARNWHPSFCRAGSAISNGGCRSARIGDSAVGTFYRWHCLPSWDSAIYFSASSYSTLGCNDVRLPSEWRTLAPLESIIGVLMCGISVSLLFAIVTRLINREEQFSPKEQGAGVTHRGFLADQSSRLTP
jgi:Ion channel